MATGFVLYLLYFVDLLLCISWSILSAPVYLKWQKHGLFCSFRLGGGRRSYPKWSRRLRQWLPHPEHPRSRLQVSHVVSFSLQSLSSLRCSDLFFAVINSTLYPAIRLPTSISSQSGAEFGRITFEFETSCSTDCELYFMMVRLTPVKCFPLRCWINAVNEVDVFFRM